jgi:hypothetical protein
MTLIIFAFISYAAFGWTSTPVAPIIFTNKSQDTETVAPFLTADTLDRATPDLFTISFNVNPDSLIDLTANRDNSALYFISAISPGASPSIRPISFTVFAVTDTLVLDAFIFIIHPKVLLKKLSAGFAPSVFPCQAS